MHMKSPKLPELLDSVSLLQNPSAVTIAELCASEQGQLRSFQGWRENSAAQGERWLRSCAQQGDCYAMEVLGVRLVMGNGVPASMDLGLSWLRRAAAAGSATAMERLSELLFESSDGSSESAESDRWLRKAAALGLRAAQVAWASRLILAPSPVRDIDAGERILREVAAHGNRLAHIKLASYVLSGALPGTAEEGRRWLRRVGAVNARDVSDLGWYSYLRARARFPRTRRQLTQESAVLLEESARGGCLSAETRLAHLLRRREIEHTSVGSLTALLARAVAEGDPFALVNQALRLADGLDCTSDCEAADAVLRKMTDTRSALAWWQSLAAAGDPEGDRVLEWLYRIGLASDPQSIARAATQTHPAPSQGPD